MIKLGGLLLCLVLAGCVTLPGAITERVSGFDKTKEIIMKPAQVNDGFLNLNTVILLGLYRTSKMAEDEATLEAIVLGAYNFSNKESLQFNIDGEKVYLESMDLLTNIETVTGGTYAQNESSKRYLVKKDFIKRLIDGKGVWVRVNLARDYVEGKFSVDGMAAVRPAFRNFYKKVWGANEVGGKE